MEWTKGINPSWPSFMMEEGITLLQKIIPKDSVEVSGKSSVGTVTMLLATHKVEKKSLLKIYREGQG